MMNELAKLAHENSVAKGFYDNGQGTNISEKLMLIVSELAEGCEALRNKSRFNNTPYPSVEHIMALPNNIFKAAFLAHVKDTFEDELADAIIRILDLAGYLKIDIENHVKAKMRFNTTRERLHGKAF